LFLQLCMGLAQNKVDPTRLCLEEWKKKEKPFFSNTKAYHKSPSLCRRSTHRSESNHILIRIEDQSQSSNHTKMFLTRTEYDRGVNTFSPEGRLFQVEYAIEAIKLGSTAIGLKTKEGVVLAVEKRITSPLLEPSSVEKIMEIDDHIGCAMSGLIADARTLVEHARVETQNHRFSYGEPMTVESTTQALCDLALRFGEGDEESMSRPFGVSLLIAGHDEHGPSLYYTDPSGTFWQCNAKAIGSGSEGADSSLQEQYNKELTLQEAETIALSILKQVMEEKVTPNNVDIAKVAPTYHLYTPSEVEAKRILDFKPRILSSDFDEQMPSCALMKDFMRGSNQEHPRHHHHHQATRELKMKSVQLHGQLKFHWIHLNYGSLRSYLTPSQDSTILRIRSSKLHTLLWQDDPQQHQPCGINAKLHLKHCRRTGGAIFQNFDFLHDRK
ncbi:20S proteasome alpha subunit E2, partial [Prunus dulcis]